MPEHVYKPGDEVWVRATFIVDLNDTASVCVCGDEHLCDVLFADIRPATEPGERRAIIAKFREWAESQESTPPEFAKFIEEHFWELFGNSERLGGGA